MAMHLKDPGNLDLRRMAVEHWHRSLELKPDQPRIRNLVEKYRLPVTDAAAAIFVDSP
jgi:hypothetical protein